MLSMLTKNHEPIYQMYFVQSRTKLPNAMYKLSHESLSAYIPVSTNKINQQLASVFPIARPKINLNDPELVSYVV